MTGLGLQSSPGMKEGIDKVVTETTPAKRWAEPTEIGEVMAISLHCMHIGSYQACQARDSGIGGSCLSSPVWGRGTPLS